MDKIQFIVVAPEMVWQWYYDQFGNKHVKELLGKEAMNFISSQETTAELVE